MCLTLQEKADLGELNFSLCYLPTAGRLTATVIKATNLKAMDLTGFSGKRLTRTHTAPRQRVCAQKKLVVDFVNSFSLGGCCSNVQLVYYNKSQMNDHVI